MLLGSVWNSVCGTLFGYETQKVVQIHSKTIGFAFRLIQLGIILYVIVWVMIMEKGYQSFDQAVSGVTAKLKGVSFVNASMNNIHAQVFDAADYVIPPQQKAAFFVMTNMVATKGQTLGNCEESDDVYGNDCHTNADCKMGELVMIGSGMKTGKCVNSTRSKKSVCEVYGWCPTEIDIRPTPHLISTAENFTVMLKNSIEFPKYGVKRRNILSWMDKTFLYKCRYNASHSKNKYCPIFRLGDIIDYTKSKNMKIWEYGGMISIHIEWNCNLDYGEEQCLPKYIFRRLDDFESPVGKGWNFRYAQHYRKGNENYRNLIKAYGIQFFITVYGKGGKFDIITFTMNLGSGLALLGIATVLCDMIVLNVTRKREVYRSAKVDTVANATKYSGKKNNKLLDLDKNKTNTNHGSSQSLAAGLSSTGQQKVTISLPLSASHEVLTSKKGKIDPNKLPSCDLTYACVPHSVVSSLKVMQNEDA